MRLRRALHSIPFSYRVPLIVAALMIVISAIISQRVLDRLSHTVKRAGREIVLQPREFRLLEYLMRHAGQVVTRTMLLENVWDYHFDPQTNVIDVHVSRLRSKIE